MTIQDLLAHIDAAGLPMDAPVYLTTGALPARLMEPAILCLDDLEEWDELRALWPDQPCLVLDEAAH